MKEGSTIRKRKIIKLEKRDVKDAVYSSIVSSFGIVRTYFR